MSEKENIFDTAAKTLGKNKKKNVNGKPKAKAPTVTPYVKVDPELEMMLNRMHEIQDDLKAKLRSMYKQHGLTEEQVMNFLNNPKNLTPQEVEELKKAQELLKTQSSLSVLSSEQEQTKRLYKKAKKPEELKRERKGKTLGARKQWMPVR